MERIIQEKISADHLLYVSLKYTKTCDVMLNLITRWKSMIGQSIDRLLEHAKKKRKISKIPDMPKGKIEKVKEVYKKSKNIIEATNLYEFFKRVENCQKQKEGEFRKNVTLKILDKGEWVSINLDKLKEYADILEKFISEIKQLL